MYIMQLFKTTITQSCGFFVSISPFPTARNGREKVSNNSCRLNKSLADENRA